MMLMPVMFGYITLIVPSGLTLYWFTSNVLQIVQQGLTTGWSGILPSKKQPALATTGSKSVSPRSYQQEHDHRKHEHERQFQRHQWCWRARRRHGRWTTS